MAKPRKPHKDEVTTGQRALWTFLGATLVGPFTGALLITVASFVAGVAGFWPPNLRMQPGQFAPMLAEQALRVFVWAAFPAAVAGSVCAAWLSLNGTLPWLVAAVSAAVATTIAVVITDSAARAYLTPLAFVAAITGIAVWALLQKAKIIG